MQAKMGMVTYITHPGDGRELEIKTGIDGCSHHKLGDIIDFSNDDYWGPGGTLVDGAYKAYGDDGPDGWVFILNWKIVAVTSEDKQSIWLCSDIKQLPDIGYNR